jgi:hypothetical protein
MAVPSTEDADDARVHVRVRLPAVMYDAVAAEADARGMSVTRVIERAVAAHLGWRRHRPPGEQTWSWAAPNEP